LFLDCVLDCPLDGGLARSIEGPRGGKGSIIPLIVGTGGASDNL